MEIFEGYSIFIFYLNRKQSIVGSSDHKINFILIGASKKEDNIRPVYTVFQP